jgi:hypothetical protein
LKARAALKQYRNRQQSSTTEPSHFSAALPERSGGRETA